MNSESRSAFGGCDDVNDVNNGFSSPVNSESQSAIGNYAGINYGHLSPVNSESQSALRGCVDVNNGDSGQYCPVNSESQLAAGGFNIGYLPPINGESANRASRKLKRDSAVVC